MCRIGRLCEMHHRRVPALRLHYVLRGRWPQPSASKELACSWPGGLVNEFLQGFLSPPAEAERPDPIRTSDCRRASSKGGGNEMAAGGNCPLRVDRRVQRSKRAGAASERRRAARDRVLEKSRGETGLRGTAGSHLPRYFRSLRRTHAPS